MMEGSVTGTRSRKIQKGGKWRKETRMRSQWEGPRQ